MRAALYLGLVVAGVAGAGETILWSDEFDEGTAPNDKVWSYDLGTGSSGWGNFELQEYTDNPENVRVEDGVLKITAVKTGESSNATFTSGRIKTEDKVTFQYGTIEARIRMPDLADGLWPAFWTLGNNFSQVGWPFCGEIDIVEMGSRNAILQQTVNRTVASTAHWENEGYPPAASYGLALNAPQDLNDDFHVFRLEWTPSFINTYVDGEEIWEIDITPSSCTDCEEFHRPHFMLLNLAVGGNFTGRNVAGAITAPMPAEMQVDWVRVYDNGFTILGGTEGDGVPDALGPGHSGSWFNADQSGHGFSMEIGGTPEEPIALIYWYVYDDDGAPIFLVGQGTPDGSGVTVDFVSPIGMRFGEFDPSTVERPLAGTGRFDFEDQDTGTFSYTPSEFSVETWGHAPIEELPIVRLFAVPQLGVTR